MKRMKKWLENDYIIRLWLSSILFAIMGGVLFGVASKTESVVMLNFFNSIGAVLIVSGIYNVIYEYILKSKLIDLIVEKVKLKNSIDKVGIEDIMLRSDDVPYRELIRKTTSRMTIVHAYGATWTRNYIEIIKQQCLQRNLDITVILLSINSEFCDSIEAHYGKEKGSMANSIQRVTEYWEDLGKEVDAKSVVKVYYYDGNPVHSLYKFDSKIVAVSNKISNKLSLNLPCIICNQKKDVKEGLYYLYEEEIGELISKGNLIYSNLEGKNERNKDI